MTTQTRKPVQFGLKWLFGLTALAALAAWAIPLDPLLGYFVALYISGLCLLIAVQYVVALIAVVIHSALAPLRRARGGLEIAVQGGTQHEPEKGWL